MVVRFVFGWVRVSGEDYLRLEGLLLPWMRMLCVHLIRVHSLAVVEGVMGRWGLFV